MAEEQNGGAPATEGAEQVAVARTDWEQAQLAIEKQRSLEREAEVMGFAGDPDGYVEYLRSTTYEHLTNKGKQPEPAAQQQQQQARPQVTQQQQAQPQPAQPDESVRAMAGQALLESQYLSFQMENSSLPEDARSKHSRVELSKVIQSSMAPMIAQMASDPQFGGNIFKAADSFLTFQESRKAPNPAATATTTRAATTSALGPGVTVTPPGGAQGNTEQQLLGRIAPKTNDVYEGERT